jgi:hypothetical protein
MRDVSDQEAGNAGYNNDERDEFDVEISDLPPDKRSHFLLLKLANTRRRGRMAAQTFARLMLNAFAASRTSDAQEEAREDEQFALEISNLPPSARSHYLLLKLEEMKARVRALLPFSPRPAGHPGAPLTRPQRRMRIGRAMTALGLCATLLVLLIGNVPDLRTRFLTLFQAPAPAATSSTSISSSASIFTFGTDQQGVPIIVERHGLPGSQARGRPGPLPAVCPKASNLQSFMTPLDPPGVGGGPIWLTGFVGPTAALVDLQPLATSLSNPPGEKIGWYEGVTVFIQRGFSGLITLRGLSQEPGGQVFFASNNPLNFSDTMVLDSSTFHLEKVPNGSEWQVTSINLIVPFAGCYTLEAAWPGGSWFAYFAAGS